MLLARCGCFTARDPISRGQIGLVTPESTGSMSMIGGRNSWSANSFAAGLDPSIAFVQRGPWSRPWTVSCVRGCPGRRLRRIWL